MGCATSSETEEHHQRYEVKPANENSPRPIGPHEARASTKPNTASSPDPQQGSPDRRPVDGASPNRPPPPREAFNTPPATPSPTGAAAGHSSSVRPHDAGKPPLAAPPVKSDGAAHAQHPHYAPSSGASSASQAQHTPLASNNPPIITIPRHQPMSMPSQQQQLDQGNRSPSSCSNHYGPGSQEPSSLDVGESDAGGPGCGPPWGRFIHGLTREPDPTMQRAVWSLMETVGVDMPMDDFVGMTPETCFLNERFDIPTYSVQTRCMSWSNKSM
jgi:hypothetical protein